jgi:pyruvate dehydrogenase E1 component alpha subunit
VAKPAEPDRAKWLGWYRQMVLIRVFEDKVQELYSDGLVPGTTHLCQGQEAVCVGAVSSMQKDDFMTTTYRGHGHALARGVDMEAMFAELMGRATGICGGMGGSMHIMDRRLGMLGAFAIVGAGIPVAVGAAMSAKLLNSGAVALAFFGDGATNIGTFHEALNMASVWRAPVVFICENNLYGEFSPVRHTTPMDDLASRASAYGIPGSVVDGMDVRAVHDETRRAILRARKGAGPTLLEMKTYRYRGHSRSDPARYRPAGELDKWKERDPIHQFGDFLVGNEVLAEADLRSIQADLQKQVDRAADQAAGGKFPDMDEARTYVFAE